MMEGPGADSEEKHEPASDINTVVVDSLKRLTRNGRLEKRTSAEHVQIPFKYGSLAPPDALSGGDMRREIHLILASPNWQREPRASNRRDGLFVQLACLLAALSCCNFPRIAAADEAGTSFWLPGQYGSFAAVPSQPGWSFENSYYHASADAGSGITFERAGGVQAGMKSPSDFFMFTPTYAFETPIFGAQTAFGTTILYGKNATSVSATLTGPGGNTLSGSKSDEVLGFGDLYPTVSLKWNKGVNNFMAYATTGIPVETRIAWEARDG